MKTAFLIDSTFPRIPRIVEKENVYTVYLRILLEGKEYSSKDIRAEDVFQSIEQTNKFPKTSLPNAVEVQEMFSQIQKDGYERIIVLTMSKGLSGTFQMIQLLADEFSSESGIDIYCADSNVMNVGSVLAFDFLEMYINQHENATREEIHKSFEAMKEESSMYVVLGDLQHIMKGGRLTKAQFLAGELLKIKPVLVLDDDGKVAVLERLRGTKKALRHVFELIERAYAKTGNQLKVYIMHTKAQEMFDELYKKCQELPITIEVLDVQIDAVTGTHVGPHTVAVAFTTWTENYQ